MTLNEKIYKIIDTEDYYSLSGDLEKSKEMATDIEKLFLQEQMALLNEFVNFPYILHKKDLQEKITELSNRLNELKKPY